MMHLRRTSFWILMIFLATASYLFANGAGKVIRVDGDEVTIALEEGKAKKGDGVRIVHVTSGGMEIEAGTWIVQNVSGKEVIASVQHKKVTPRKGMKAFFQQRNEKDEPQTPAHNVVKRPQNYNDAASSTPIIDLERKAVGGDAYSQYRLGVICQNGEGVEKDLAKALYWYKKAAAQNYLPAVNIMGWTYQKGLGVEIDLKKAVAFYRKAGDRGFAPAQDNMGWMYQTGQGVPRNYERAFAWYKKAADQNHANAQNNLGIMLSNGLGVDKDFAAAAQWYLKAAEQGHSMAQFNLAQSYRHGKGVSRDKAKAIFWHKKAAAAGNQGSIRELAELENIDEQ